MSDTETETTSVYCPLCQDLYEVKNPELVLLAAHVSEHCEETVGILHD